MPLQWTRGLNGYSPLCLDDVVHTSFDYTGYQPRLFVAESLTHVLDTIRELEVRIRAGRLLEVGPGEPEISDADIAPLLSPQTSSLRHAA